MMATDTDPTPAPFEMDSTTEFLTVHHERAAKRRAKPSGVPQINLVSLMDVTFLLLIFFVLTSNFAVGEGVLPAELPRGHAAYKPTSDPVTPLTIQVRTRGGGSLDIVYEVIGSDVVTNPEELFRLLASLQRNEHNPNGFFLPKDPVVIQPNEDVPWGDVVEAFNQAVRAKYQDVNFARARKP